MTDGQLINAALARLSFRPSTPLTRGLQATLEGALRDHALGLCHENGGCVSVSTARSILNGEF